MASLRASDVYGSGATVITNSPSEPKTVESTNGNTQSGTPKDAITATTSDNPLMAWFILVGILVVLKFMPKLPDIKL